MNERKWTKGPWKIVYGGADDDGYAVIGSPHRISPIANLEPIFFVSANACLIAAAPELYEALEIVHACGEVCKISLYDEEAVEGWIWYHPDGREWTVASSWNEPAPMHPVAAAALAKARGEA